jgi:hypothetical protein
MIMRIFVKHTKTLGKKKGLLTDIWYSKYAEEFT